MQSSGRAQSASARRPGSCTWRRSTTSKRFRPKLRRPASEPRSTTPVVSARCIAEGSLDDWRSLSMTIDGNRPHLRRRRQRSSPTAVRLVRRSAGDRCAGQERRARAVPTDPSRCTSPRSVTVGSNAGSRSVSWPAAAEARHEIVGGRRRSPPPCIASTSAPPRPPTRATPRCAECPAQPGRRRHRRAPPDQGWVTISKGGQTIWRFLAVRPAASSGTNGSGIELRCVDYRGKRVLHRAHVADPQREVHRRCLRALPRLAVPGGHDPMPWAAIRCRGSGCARARRRRSWTPARTQGNFLGVGVYTAGRRGRAGQRDGGRVVPVHQRVAVRDGRHDPTSLRVRGRREPVRVQRAPPSRVLALRLRHPYGPATTACWSSTTRRCPVSRSGTTTKFEVRRHRDPGPPPKVEGREHHAPGAGYEIIPRPDDGVAAVGA